MPEGDTVFLTCHRLHEALAGRTLTHGELRHPRLSTVSLDGWTVRAVIPVGKHLLIRFDTDRTLHSHLRMDGSWHLYSPGSRWRRPAHQARAVLSHPQRVAVGFNVHDLRVIPTDDEHRLIGHLGPDLLALDWSGEHAAEAVRRLGSDPDREIGLALLDQTAMAGVGNLYKTEVCFLLGCSPRTPVGRVDLTEAVRRCRELLLRNAWHPEQTTTGNPRASARHWVYERRLCLRCAGPVERGVQGPDDRVTYRCPHCQP
ncbi:DNA-formamidopyrimidine glycosylase family protein [Parasphingorhabdus pacifica]